MLVIFLFYLYFLRFCLWFYFLQNLNFFIFVAYWLLSILLYKCLFFHFSINSQYLNFLPLGICSIFVFFYPLCLLSAMLALCYSFSNWDIYSLNMWQNFAYSNVTIQFRLFHILEALSCIRASLIFLTWQWYCCMTIIFEYFTAQSLKPVFTTSQQYNCVSFFTACIAFSSTWMMSSMH